jgi:hypothetical protein
MCPIPNGFRDRAISVYSCKIVDKGMLPIISNIGIYCSSDKVGTVHLVQYIFENSTVNISTLFSSCEDKSCCSSVCILRFFYAGNKILYEIEQFFSCIHLQQPTNASHQFTCFIQWRRTAGVKGNIERQIQIPLP